MTPAQLRELERLAMQAAQAVQAAKDKRRGIRRIAVPVGPVPENLTVLRCVRCNAPQWAANAPRNANGDVCCPAHVGEALHGSTNARTLCAHCGDTVASGVWRYGGTVNFGKGPHDWHKDAALCAACGFDAVNWLTLVRPELPKGTQKRMTLRAIMAWHRKNPPRAMRYIQWCRLLHDGQEAAAAFAASVRKALEPEPQEPLFDMTDPEGAWRFLQSVGLAQRCR